MNTSPMTPAPDPVQALLPCPFCGNGAHIRDDFQHGQDGGGFCYAVCELCGARGTTILAISDSRIVCEQDRVSAMRAWNRRALQASADPGLVEWPKDAPEADAWYECGLCRIGLIHTDKAVVQSYIDKENARLRTEGVSLNLHRQGPYPFYPYDAVHDLEVELDRARAALVRSAAVRGGDGVPEAWPIRCLTLEDQEAATARGLKTYCIPGESGVFARPYNDSDYWNEVPDNKEADANLAALLNYTEGFYASAIEAGMNAGYAANAVAHVERAARRLHALAAAPPAPQGASGDVGVVAGSAWL